ncbi:MAG: baseplate J/gp47 family protein [Gammaproteobacteria bacterium]|nr:baseplate J/gp47 family protein [Gammaproteobacteria bacterium]
MSDRPNYTMPDGTEQADRFPRALEPGYFQPEERGFNASLALGFDIAKHFAFYDLSDQRRGAWGDLFATNEVVVMAHILSADVRQLESEFASRCDRGLEHSVQFAFETAQEIDLWLTTLRASRHPVAGELSDRIQPLLSKSVTGELQRLAQIIDLLRPDMPALMQLSFGGFHRLWGIRPNAGDAATAVRDMVQPLRDQVRTIVASLLNFIAHLQGILRPYLAEALPSQRHEPAIALFFVFLKLLEKVNGQFNRFTARHLDFYYRRVLGAHPHRQRSDHRYFSVRPAEGHSGILFPAGTELVARAGDGGGELVFISERDTLISDARVESLCTLRFERDRFISPETELGYVTRIKAFRRDLGVAAQSGASLADWPLFGTSSRLAGYRSAEDANIGFAVASPLLLLGEGRRSVELQVELGDCGESGARPGYDLFRRELQALRGGRAGAEQAFRQLLGRIFRHFILFSDAGVDAQFRQQLTEVARQLLAPQAQRVLEQLLQMGPEAAFQRLLKEIFVISLTTPSGWYFVDRFVTTRLERDPGRLRQGLCFRFTLGPEVEPIVCYSGEIHGGRLGAAAPLIRFQHNPQASFCAYSLFDPLPLEAVTLDVRVQGLRDLKLYNNIGKIDSSKPFQPFGPQPTLSSYLALGSYEVAQKRLTGLTLNLEWAELPTAFGGFTSHYAGYQQAIAEADIRVDIAVLQDGIWRPQPERQRPSVPLFQPTGPTDRLNRTHSIAIEALDLFRPIDAVPGEAKFDLQLGAGNGFIRLGLSGPEGAFGHAEYPLLLATALSERVRAKKPLGRVPNPPYTPLLASVSVDYAARTRICVDDGRTQPRQQLFHLHPFGHAELRPIRAGNPYALLPRYDTDGNLFIGINGGASGEALTLLFDLNEETNQQSAFESPSVTWYYLNAQGWQRLPAMNIVLDTSNGFICSGVVTLILPEDLDRQSSMMPAGRAWLRVGANECLDALPRLRSVHANVIRARRRVDAGAQFPEELPPDSRWRTAGSVPGIAALVQLRGSQRGAPQESRRGFLTRISERLNHKARAVNAWDYERLVLERFPEVFKVKCFEGLVPAEFDPEAEAQPRPGRVLVVVVPAAGEGENLAYRRPMLDVQQLQRIRDYIRQLASPFVSIEVRNPLYERVQVRCKAKFLDDTNAGFYVRKLNRDVSDFLCPWIPFGYQARFGWMISREAVEGFIRSRDYVEQVTDFSMLHIAEDGADRYTLADTVSRGSSTAQSHRIRWRYPWSLAVPMERHFIEAMRGVEPIEPEPAGIGELDIGGTFIIGGTH